MSVSLPLAAEAMGCGTSSPEERAAKSVSSSIDRQLRADARVYENTIKILLLGECECVCVSVHKYPVKIYHCSAMYTYAYVALKFRFGNLMSL